MPARSGKDLSSKFLRIFWSMVMKKNFRKAFFTCGVLLMLLASLPVAAKTMSFVFFYIRILNKDTKSCTQYFTGMDKGVFWSNGEWHHYVDFEVGDLDPLYRWDIVDAPLPSSFSREYAPSSVKRVTYRWPSNWQDPFPANDWKICIRSES